jgi:hypothetical protein
MSSIVSVVFDHNREYELIAHGVPREKPLAERQWEGLECEPSTHGQVLVLDKILCVAKYGGKTLPSRAVVAAMPMPLPACSTVRVQLDVDGRVVG